MNKKTAVSLRLSRIILTSFVMLLNIAATSSAVTITWSNGGLDGDWNNPANWAGTIPDAIDDSAKINMAAGPVFSTGRTATAYRVYLEGTNGTITMNGGGSLTTVNHIYMAALSTDTAILNMSGGTINIGSTSFHHLYCGQNGAATFNMGGGAMNISGNFNVALNAGSIADVNLSGGTITCKVLSMGASDGTGTINITSTGTLIVDSNGANVSTYITNGWIKAYNGAGTVMVDINNINPGKTTVWASAPTKAVVPSPADNAANVSILTDLSWMGIPGATSHNVYFGTSSSPAFVSNQTEATFDPGILDFTTYYWRIDEIVGPNTVTGDLWTFSTVSGLAENPNPISGATEVALYKVLSWTPGYGAVSHDVYLGTDVNAVRNAERLEGDLDGSGRVDYNDIHILANYWLENPAGSEPYAGVNYDNIVDFADYALLTNNWKVQPSPLFKGNTTDTRYNDPCDFAINTTYYWRVDEVNGPENRKGDVWSFTTTVYSESLIGKVMCGYQGWFNCPSDGTTRGWIHWSTSTSSFTPSTVRVDMWPDMNEMTTGEKFLASAFDEGSTHFYVFSSHNLTTVRRHFQWMQQYGIDGVYLQRFATEIKSQTSKSFYHRNDVLDYCKDGANMYGKKYAVMYDLSGLSAGQTSYVINDWKYLVDTKHVTMDPNYMHHRGKPVVAVWGIGFNDGRAYTLAECLTLVNFLRNDPVYGGNIVMVGVPSYWRTLNQDCVPDPNVHTIIRAADIVSPWSVGRYSTSAGVAAYADNVWTQDINWCEANSTPSHPIEYLPVIFPGFSWHNMQPTYPLNQIPRVGGQFLWDQVKATVATAHANMLYIAMFDEVDEGTAIFKVTNNPPRPGGVDMFVTPDFDGYPLPSDEYLWLTGQAGKALRGEISPVPSTRPAR
jgi:hypothetical protein